MVCVVYLTDVIANWTPYLFCLICEMEAWRILYYFQMSFVQTSLRYCTCFDTIESMFRVGTNKFPMGTLNRNI